MTRASAPPPARCSRALTADAELRLQRLTQARGACELPDYRLVGSLDHGKRFAVVCRVADPALDAADRGAQHPAQQLGLEHSVRGFSSV